MKVKHPLRKIESTLILAALTPEQRETGRQARLIISRELGHERAQITAAYLGK